MNVAMSDECKNTIMTMITADENNVTFELVERIYTHIVYDYTRRLHAVNARAKRIIETTNTTQESSNTSNQSEEYEPLVTSSISREVSNVAICLSRSYDHNRYNAERLKPFYCIESEIEGKIDEMILDRLMPTLREMADGVLMPLEISVQLSCNVRDILSNNECLTRESVHTPFFENIVRALLPENADPDFINVTIFLCEQGIEEP